MQPRRTSSLGARALTSPWRGEVDAGAKRRRRVGVTASTANTSLVCFTPPRLSRAKPGSADPPPPGEGKKSRGLVAGLGAVGPRLVLRDVVLGRLLQQRAHLVLHGRDPVGHLHPLGAVPLLHVGAVVAVVVAARDLV